MPMLHRQEDDIQSQLAALRNRVDVLERVFEAVFQDKPARAAMAIRTKRYKGLPVKCDVCGAEPGEPCKSPKDTPTNTHLDRIRAHARAVLASPRPAGR